MSAKEANRKLLQLFPLVWGLNMEMYPYSIITDQLFVTYGWMDDTECYLSFNNCLADMKIKSCVHLNAFIL